VLNDDASFHRVADAGVNGLITDYPGNFELTNPSLT
jgi:glycerophosphoryl diester phosphodiesterase